MENIKRNQLAELIVEDGQPSRAIINYLQETMSLLSNFDCVTDYYTRTEEHPLISGAPTLKLTKSLFINAISVAYGQLRESNNKPFELSDLYMNLNYVIDRHDEDFREGIDLPLVSYYLSTSDKEKDCSDFLIIFNSSIISNPIIASINVDYYDDLDSHKTGKFKEADNTDKSIYLTVNGTEGEHIIQYEKDEIKYIIPLNEVSF